MPFAPLWLSRIPDAVAQLEQLDRDALTRKDLEQLFGVSRALAAQLMHRFGADPRRLATGARSRGVDPHAEDAAARAPGDKPPPPGARPWSPTLRQRAARGRPQSPCRAAVLQTHVAGLPAGVALGPGRIEVRFASVPEALQQLFTLAQAITNDYDRFAAIVSATARGEGRGVPVMSEAARPRQSRADHRGARR